MSRPSGPPPLPEPLPHPVVDGHTHLDHARQGELPVPVEQALALAASVGVDRAVQIGCELDSARWTVELLQRQPGLVGGVALHPTEAADLYAAGGRAALEAAWAEIETLSRAPGVRVVGETGLDFYWVSDPVLRAVQRESFAWHIDLAKRTGAVLQIHDRDAHAEVLDVLAAEGAPERTVFHCFSGDARMARACAEQGWFLSFAGTVTFGNAGALREALAVTPAELVLVETDAPYLTPHPHRGRPNSSAQLPHTVRAVAQVLGRDLGELCALVDRTATRLYGPFNQE